MELLEEMFPQLTLPFPEKELGKTEPKHQKLKTPDNDHPVWSIPKTVGKSGWRWLSLSVGGFSVQAPVWARGIEGVLVS